MELPNDFFTVATLATLGGSVTAVWTVTSGLGYLMGLQNSQKFKRWIGFILSLALALVLAAVVKDRSMLTWVVGIVNGFLIYAAAVGVNTIASPTSYNRDIHEPPVRETGAVENGKRGRFRERWW